MVLSPPAEPSEFNSSGTFVRLSLLQNLMVLPKVTHTQTILNNNPVTLNNDIENTPTTKLAQTNDQSTVILQQFSMIGRYGKMSQVKCPGLL